jgi:hypothetical protein
MIERISVTLTIRTEFGGPARTRTFAWDPEADDPIAALLSAKNDDLLNAQVAAAGPAIGTLET